MKPTRLLPLLVLGAALPALPLAARQAHAPAPSAAQAPAHAPAQADGHGAPKAEGQGAPKPEGHDAAPAGSHAAADGHATPAEGHGPAHAGAEHGGAHHGPAIKLFGTELSAGQQAGIKVFNFLLFAAGLFFLLKGALSAAFKTRAKEVEERLAQAEKDRLEGEAQMRHLEDRMAGLQAELDGILAKAGADAEAEKSRILEAAKSEAGVILAQAQADIEASQRAAEAELRALVAQLAVEGAAQRLQSQLQGGTAATAIDRAIQQVGASSGGLQ